MTFQVTGTGSKGGKLLHRPEQSLLVSLVFSLVTVRTNCWKFNSTAV